MIPTYGREIVWEHGIPRESGDDPVQEGTEYGFSLYSPRERG